MAPRFFRLLISILILTGSHFSSKPAYANEHHSRLIDLLNFALPNTTGPYPVVVLVSGCDGFKSGGYDGTEDDLNRLGYATARVDFMQARDGGGCAYQPTKSRIARDILFVLDHLSGTDNVNHSAVNVLAWSSGGGGALSMMSKLEERPDIQLASVSVYYPQCSNVFPWSGDVPVLMLLGGADNIDPAVFCKNLATKSPDARIRIEEYAGAYHAFDDPSLPIKTDSLLGTMGYHKDAAERSWVEVTSFLHK